MSVPLNRYIAFVLSNRKLVLGLSVAVMLVLAVGLRTITISNDWRDMLDEGNPQLVAFDAMEAAYSATNAAVIAVAPRGGGSVFTRKALGAIEELTEAAWHVPRATRVDSITNYNHTEAEEDDLIVERLVDDVGSLNDNDLARIRKIALSEGSIVGRLVSKDGRVAGLVIDFAMPERSDAAEIEIYRYIRSLLEKSRKAHPDIEYHVTGNVFVNQVLTESAQEDMRILIPAAFFIIAAVATILLRSLFGTLSLVTVVIFTVISTMGVIGWIGLVLNAANSSVPLIIMTLAIAHSVHVVESIITGMRRGLDRDAAIAESLRKNAWPVFLTTATTMIGFFSMNASDSPPFRTLGNLTAFGILCGYVYSMTLLPALLSVLPLRVRPSRTRGSSFFNQLGTFVVARRTILLWAVGAVTIALVAGVPRVELTDNWTQHLDERYEFRHDTDFVIDNLTGVDTLEYSLDSGREAGITDPGYLRKIEAFAEWYRTQPEVMHVQVFTDIMKRLNKNMNVDNPAFYRLPENSALAAQYLLLYELSVPFGMDLNNRINVAKSATRMTVTLKRLKSEELRALEARGQKWLSANAPDLAKEASGYSLIFAHLAIQNTLSMLWGTIIGMIFISLILIGVFKSLRLGLISLVPNLIPAAMTFGVWGYLYSEVGPAGSLVMAIAFGIVVDDTIHFMSKYLKGRREGLSSPEAVRSTFRSVGFALFSTTSILVLGFLVFATSGFAITWMLGLLVALTLSFALLLDLLLLPSLLMALDRKGSQ